MDSEQETVPPEEEPVSEGDFTIQEEKPVVGQQDNTLEPIHPLEQTPYGAFVIDKNVVCTPTSLCTYAQGEPVVYCKMPEHTLNPVCLKVNQGIGLLGCHAENTCGGLTTSSATEDLLKENPEYQVAISQEEQKQGRPPRNPMKKKKLPWWQILLIVVLILLLTSLIVYFGFKYDKKRRMRRGVTRSLKHSTSRKT